MRSRFTAGVAALVLAIAATLVAPVLTAPAYANSCSHAHSDRDPTVGQFLENFTNIRQGPHYPPGLSCLSNGQGQAGQGADYHCFTFNGDSFNGATTWTWVRNTSTQVQGWVNDALLSGFGSFFIC